MVNIVLSPPLIFRQHSYLFREGIQVVHANWFGFITSITSVLLTVKDIFLFSDCIFIFIKKSAVIARLHRNVYSTEFYKVLSIIIMPFSVVKWVWAGRANEIQRPRGRGRDRATPFSLFHLMLTAPSF